MKLKKMKTAKTLSLLMVLMLVLQLMPMSTALAEGSDSGDVWRLGGTNIGQDGTGDAFIHDLDGKPFTGWDKVDPLKSFIKIFQSDGITEIPKEEDGSYEEIPANAVVQFQVGFHLTEAKRGADFNSGDFFELSLPEGLEFIGTTNGKLTTQGKDFAEWSITAGKLKVVLTGDVQELVTEIWGKIAFKGYFKYMEELDPSAGTTRISFGGHIINISRKSKETDPKPPAKSTLTKEHTYNPDANEITWTVTVTPPDEFPSFDYSNFELIDELSGAHTYKPGSFTVKNSGGTYDSVSDTSLKLESENKKITYTFPSGHTPLGTQVIRYITKINTIDTGSDAINEFKNTADLKKDSFDAANAVAEDTFQMAGFFAKTGTAIFKGADGKSAYVEWKVNVKMPKGSFYLPNARIIDTLPAPGAGFVPHEFFDGTASVLSGGVPESKDLFVTIEYPDGSTAARVTDTPGAYGDYDLSEDKKELTYNFGASHPAANPDTEQEYTLTYYTKISNWESSLNTNDGVGVKNNAKIEWTPSDGVGSGTSIGAVGISKPVIAGGGLISKSTTAEAEFEHGAAASTIKGDYIQWVITLNSNRIPMTGVSITDDVVTVADHIFAADQPFTVKKNGETTGKTFINNQEDSEYGKLSDVTDGGFRFTLPSGPISDSYVITFYTKITQKAFDDMYRGNQTGAKKTFKNGVTINDHLLANPRVEATKTYKLEMLKKSAGSYNHDERSITWTLRVNRNSLPMKNAVITDEFPDGMVLFPAVGDLGVFRVSINDGAPQVLPDNIIFDGTTTPKGFTLTLPDNSDKYVFTFKTYLTDEILDGSFTSKPFSNKAKLTLDKNTAGIESTASTSITHSVIKKDTKYVSAKKEDVITWEVQINPGRVDLKNAWVEDILNDDLDLDKITVKLYDGYVNPSSGNVTKNDENTTFDINNTDHFEHGFKADGPNAGKEYFKLRLPDGKNAYVLVFSTVVTAEGVSIDNSITLSGETGFPESISTKTGVSVHEIYETAGSSAYTLKVKKLGNDGLPLKDVEFVLLKPNGEPVKKGGVDYKVKTGADGIAIFDGQPRWFFYVREVDPPAGYLNSGDSVKAYPTTSADMLPATPPHIIVTNILGKADVVISKVGASNLPLAGAEFELKGTPDYAGATELTLTATSNVGGIATFSNVPMGTYEISETKEPAGHVKSTTKITAKIEYADVSTKTGVKVTYTGGDGRTPNELINEPVLTDINAGVSFTKIDDDGTPIVLRAGIDGGTFTLTGTTHKGTSVTLTESVDENGLVDFGQLMVGTYKITETSAPAGYLNLAEKDIFNVVVAYTDSSYTDVHVLMTPTAANIGRYDAYTRAFKNTPATAEVKFTKNSSSSDTVKMNGGTFKISGDSETGHYEDTASAVDNVVTFKYVPVSKSGEFYTIEELVPPSGYQLTKDTITVAVSYTDGNHTAVAAPAYKDKDGNDTGSPILKNVPVPYIPGSVELSVLKTDEDGNKLAGASFTLYDSAGKTVASAISGAGGIAEFINVRGDAKYTIRETAAPEGYELSDEVISVNTLADPTFFTMVNKKLPQENGNVRIYKTDEGGDPLPGATFTLYAGGGSAIATAVSGTDGIAEFVDIPAGTSYTVRETAAPAGYDLSTEVLSFNMKKDVSLSFTLLNRKSIDAGGTVYGSLRILKANTLNEPLSGAEFTLYDSGGNVIVVTVTGSDGIAKFTNLLPGTYSVGETRAPADYRLFEGRQTFEITQNDLNKSFILRNSEEDGAPEAEGWEEIDDEEIPGDPGTPEPPVNKLPQTGGIPTSFWFFVTGATLMAAGLLSLVPRRRKGNT